MFIRSNEQISLADGNRGVGVFAQFVLAEKLKRWLGGKKKSRARLVDDVELAIG
jgi:hypothetical protein